MNRRALSQSPRDEHADTKEEAVEELIMAILAFSNAEDDYLAVREVLADAQKRVDMARQRRTEADERRVKALRQLNCAVTGKVDFA